MIEELDSEFVRRLVLHQQGLLRLRAPWGQGARAIPRAVTALGYLQLDAIAVVQRAHHHTLFSRIPNYSSTQLYTSLEQQQLFEYWHHAVAFMPIAHYRFYLHRMQRVQQQGKHWHSVDAALKQQVLDRLRAEGPLYARNFENHGHVSKGMWDGKPDKKALHELFMSGEVMVRARHGFQRLYDVRDRVLPAGLDISTPSPSELGRFHINAALNAHGLIRLSEIHYLQNDLKNVVATELNAMLEEGSLCEVAVAQVPKARYFTKPALLEQNFRRVVPRLHILSPFDNVVIQRRRLSDLFGFDYQTEIYLPPAKRRYGYFALPLLYGTRFIGRMDPKAERSTRTLNIRNLVLEPKVGVDDALVDALSKRLMEFAAFNGCERLDLSGVVDTKLKRALNARVVL